MVVKFLPVPEDTPQPKGERENLAEVIDFRTRLLRQAGADDDSAPAPAEDRGRRTVAELKQLLQSGPLSANPAGDTRGDSSEPSKVNPGEAAVERESDIAQDAVKLLARRALSSGELLAKLQDMGHSRTDAEEQVAVCESNLYLDDFALARTLCEKLRTTKGLSAMQLRLKLRERKLPDGAIEQALAELDSSEENELLHKAALDRAKRLTGLAPEVAERRLLGFLARRGWGGYEAREAARAALREAALEH